MTPTQSDPLLAPLVSIITPVFEGSKWLPSLFECIDQQKFTHFEHIIIDDCSSDSEWSEMNRIAAGRKNLRFIQLTSNAGPAVARNAGIRASSGRYIAFLDVDDVWLPTKLATQVAFMKRTGVAFSFHDYCHLSSNGELIGDAISGPDILDFRAHHIRRGTGGCLSVMIDKEQTGVFEFPIVEKKFPEDFLAWSILINNGHLGYRVPEVLGHYRIHDGNRSGNKFKVVLSVLETYVILEKIPIHKALAWWAQYCVNSLRQYKNAKPYKAIVQGALHG